MERMNRKTVRSQQGCGGSRGEKVKVEPPDSKLVIKIEYSGSVLKQEKGSSFDDHVNFESEPNEGLEVEPISILGIDYDEDLADALAQDPFGSNDPIIVSTAGSQHHLLCDSCHEAFPSSRARLAHRCHDSGEKPNQCEAGGNDFFANLNNPRDEGADIRKTAQNQTRVLKVRSKPIKKRKCGTKSSSVRNPRTEPIIVSRDKNSEPKNGEIRNNFWEWLFDSETRTVKNEPIVIYKNRNPKLPNTSEARKNVWDWLIDSERNPESILGS